MNKFIIPVIIVLLLFSSCETNSSSESSSSSSSNKNLYDFNDSLPDEQVALVHFSGVNIVEYNGIGVEWKTRIGGYVQLRFPGGDTEFILNGVTGSYNIGYTRYDNVPFKYRFEKGKEYSVIMNQHTIGIWDGKQGIFPSMKAHIASYSFSSSRGQTLTYQDGKKVSN